MLLGGCVQSAGIVAQVNYNDMVKIWSGPAYLLTLGET